MRAIVFVLRGCPVGCLGPYGNEWVLTPHLDRLAAEGVVFDRHLSDSPDPAAAGRAWRTGRAQTPPLDPDRQHPAHPSPDLLDLLRAAGVRTVLVRANHPDTDAPDSYYAGWDEVFDARPESADRSPLAALERLFPSLLDRLAEVPNWLLWLETDRLLPPWDVSQAVFEAYVTDGDDEAAGAMTDADEPVTPLADPPAGPFDRADPAAWEWLQASFAAVVSALDDELGRLLGHLRGRGLDQTAAWLVTSDLGYPLGEHGRVGVDRPWLHEELVHLPLLVRLPGAAEAGRRVAALTQPPDLMPTLLELFGVPNRGADAPRSPGQGDSLLPLARGEAESVREAAVTGLVVDGVGEWAVRTAEWAYLLPGPQPAGETRDPMLYAKPDDRWEVNDLRPRDPDRAAELDERLRNTVG